MRLLKIISFLLLSYTLQAQSSSIFPIELSCEYAKNPSVIDVLQPRFAWLNKASSKERGLAQTAYQIRVASAREKLENPDLWDSGKVVSDESIRVQYAGEKLKSKQMCYWQVRVWDHQGKVSAWSAIGNWRMGLLNPSDWKAQWIGAPWQGEDAIPRTDYPDAIPEKFGPPAPLFRKTFEAKKEIVKAVAFVTGLGYFEFYVNGKKVGEDVLIPNQTNYGKRPNLPSFSINVEDNFQRYKVMYLAYEITELLKSGKNAIAAILGNGFYNPGKFWTEGYGSPRFLGQIHITYQDGSEEIIKSDASWKASKSPILMDMVYYGEHYDARQEQKGWNTPSFDDSNWQQVLIRKAPEGDLVAHTAHPDRVTERIKPQTIKKLDNGNYWVDFGVEISGWVRLNQVKGPKGHKIELSFEANLYSGDNIYICNGDSIASYAPRFNWFVFRAIEVKNWPGELKPEHLTAEAVNTYIEESATFETSNPLFNQINKIWRRSQIDNMHGGIASDCPHRERSGYTGDGQVACATVMHNYDARNFYYKWIQDVRESQITHTGYVPNGAPWQPGCGGGVAWGAAICIMPWEFYMHYGATDILRDNFSAMQGYIEYLKSWRTEDGIIYSQRKGGNGEILKWFNLGEWAFPDEQMPDALVHTFYFWRCVDIAAKTADKLGKSKEAKIYNLLAKNIQESFHQKFYSESEKTYGNGGANILALRMGVPEAVKEAIIIALKNNIKSNQGHLDTGIFGTRFFFETLAENGLNQWAYEAMNKKDEPSFGRWIELGSTTTREHWAEKGSYNHPMFGGGLVWFYRNLAGMRADPTYPAYKHIIFKPQPIAELNFVSYHNQTVYGQAGIKWTNKSQKFILEIVVPVGSTATVYIPAKDKNKITENGKSIKDNKWLRFLRKEGNYIVLEVKSGQYYFESNKM